jgi:Winged helix-turn helix
VIERLTGVSYHPGHVWKLLRHRLHYRLQRPARRAVERDERAIAVEALPAYAPELNPVELLGDYRIIANCSGVQLPPSERLSVYRD